MKEQLMLQIVLIVLQELPNLIVKLYEIFSSGPVDKDKVEEIRSLVKDPWSYFNIKGDQE